MKSILALVQREPAMVVALILAGLNMIVTLNAEQQLQVSTIIETLIVLVAGGVVRSQVTPVSKLPASSRG